MLFVSAFISAVSELVFSDMMGYIFSVFFVGCCFGLFGALVGAFEND